MEGQIMRTGKLLASCVFGASLLFVTLQTRSLAAPVSAQSDKQDKNARPQPVRDGDRAFRQNCARCHNAPQSFPPQISGTIVRHMRVRASLSREDERAILKFLNP
jgi:mono/diheme cytochrome c family protein